MEMQQILEMLVEMKADRKADQEKADANRQSEREFILFVTRTTQHVTIWFLSNTTDSPEQWP
jgi:hypothetical protein